MLRRFAAADADIGEMLFLHRDASGCHAAGLCLDLVLARFLAAPHCFHKAFLILDCVFHLVHRDCRADMRIKEIFRFRIQILLDRLKDLSQLRGDLIHRNNDLLTCIPAHDYDLAVLDILRSDLDTGRDSQHLLLAELPSRALL